MPAPFSPSDPASKAASSSLPTVSNSLPSQPRRQTVPPVDRRDDSASESDDDYMDDGFDAARAAYLSRRIAEAAAETAARSAHQPNGASPYDESAIDREWEELVRSMKAIVPTVAHFVGSSLGPTVFALICTWLGFKFHKVALDRV